MTAPSFAWYELATTSPTDAAAFYEALVGWDAQTWGGPHDYTLLVGPGGPVGGLMTQPDDAKAMGYGPMWVGYVGVPALEPALARAVELGATVHMGPLDIPGAGRYAVLVDPQGAPFGLHQAGDGHAPAQEPGQGKWVWHELGATDPEAAIAFYGALFGWVEVDAMDMGNGERYRMIGTAPGCQAFGAVSRAAPGLPRAAWLFYAGVAKIDTALATARAAGSTVLYGPMPVPMDAFAAAIIDPQGAAFGLVGGAG